MTRTLVASIVAAAAVIGLQSAAPWAQRGTPAVEAGYTSLFNGTDLTGWKVSGADAAFTIVDGAIQANGAPNAAHLFFQLVSRRYERGSILITSNQSLAGWGEVFGDPLIATAILDRLLHHSTTINIKGESFRLKEKRKAGLLGKTEPRPAHDDDPASEGATS